MWAARETFLAGRKPIAENDVFNAKAQIYTDSLDKLTPQRNSE